MHYESTKQEFYEAELHRMAKQMAEILAQGNTIEICHSRSGLKLFSVNRRYSIISNNGTCVEKKLCLVRWGSNTSYDLRSWKTNKDGTQVPFKGIVLSRDELRELKKLLQKMEL